MRVDLFDICRSKDKDKDNDEDVDRDIRYKEI